MNAKMHDSVILTSAIWNRLSSRVQGELNRLAYDGEHFRNRYRKAEALKSDTRIQDYQDGDYGLPDGSTVIFTSSRGDVEVYVIDRGDEKVIEVKSHGRNRAGQYLAVRPRASNVVEVVLYD